MLIEFSSGAEVSIGISSLDISEEEIKIHKLYKMRDVVTYLYQTYQKSQYTLFRDNFTLSPGILCCIDEVDWQLLGSEEADVKPGQCVLFLSTMHGG